MFAVRAAREVSGRCCQPRFSGWCDSLRTDHWRLFLLWGRGMLHLRSLGRVHWAIWRLTSHSWLGERQQPGGAGGLHDDRGRRRRMPTMVSMLEGRIGEGEELRRFLDEHHGGERKGKIIRAGRARKARKNKKTWERKPGSLVLLFSAWLPWHLPDRATPVSSPCAQPADSKKVIRRNIGSQQSKEC